MLKFLKNIFQLILSPGNGWEDISHDGEDPKVLAAKGLYPIIGFASIISQAGDLVNILEFKEFFINTQVNIHNSKWIILC